MQASRVEARVNGSLAGLGLNVGDGPGGDGPARGWRPGVWAAGNVGFEPIEGAGFGTGCRIPISGRTSSFSPDYLRDFPAISLSLLDNVVPTFFFPLFSSIPKIILHPNPIFGTDFVVRASHSWIWRSSEVRCSVFLADGVPRTGFVWNLLLMCVKGYGTFVV